MKGNPMQDYAKTALQLQPGERAEGFFGEFEMKLSKSGPITVARLYGGTETLRVGLFHEEIRQLFNEAAPSPGDYLTIERLGDEPTGRGFRARYRMEIERGVPKRENLFLPRPDLWMQPGPFGRAIEDFSVWMEVYKPGLSVFACWFEEAVVSKSGRKGNHTFVVASCSPLPKGFLDELVGASGKTVKFRFSPGMCCRFADFHCHQEFYGVLEAYASSGLVFRLGTIKDRPAPLFNPCAGERSVEGAAISRCGASIWASGDVSSASLPYSGPKECRREYCTPLRMEDAQETSPACLYKEGEKWNRDGRNFFGRSLTGPKRPERRFMWG